MRQVETMYLRSPRESFSFSGLCSAPPLICEKKTDSLLRTVNASLSNVKHLYCLLFTLRILRMRTPKIQDAAGKKTSISQSKGTLVDPLRKQLLWEVELKDCRSAGH